MSRFTAARSVCLFIGLIASIQVWSAPDPDALQKANELLQRAGIIDGHNDLPWVYREHFGGDVEGYDISVQAQYDTDIPRLRAGGVAAQFWSVYVPSSLSPREAMRAQLEQIDIAHRMIRQYPKDFRLVTRAADISEANGDGRIASMLGIEGGHSIDNSLGALRTYYELGVRYMTLTHFHGNDWADSSTDTKRHEGLTEFGREVVREMNRIGMLVDLSHVSAQTMRDALETSASPVIFSHSSARALTKHSRNVPDDVLHRMSDNGGVVMVTFIPSFVNEARREWGADLLPLLKDATTDAEWAAITHEYTLQRGEPPAATLSDVADHIDYVAKVAGFDHVGIGGDFFGAEGNELTQGLEDVSRYPDLIAELIRRGWSDENLIKLCRGNLLRVFAAAEAVSADLQQQRAPSLKTIEQLDGSNQPS